MYTNFKISILSKILGVFYFLLLAVDVRAEPYLAVKNNLKCASCHVNPIGGGARNQFGQTYGQSVLPEKIASFNTSELTKINEYLGIGADARFNANYQKDDADTTSQTFATENLAVYGSLLLPESGLTFYLDQQVAPGTSINREAWVMKTLDSGNYVKVGKMFLPYGLRLEDDSAFIRQVTGMNFDNSDNGIEYTINSDKSTINLFMANGTSQATNNDDTFLYGVRGEQLFQNFRLGATAVLNDGDQQSQLFNIYGGLVWDKFTLLAEVDYINLQNANPLTSADVEQLITFFEVNYQWQKGLNFKLTAEYLDPDQDIDENEQTRYSFVTEYTPLSNFQFRLGIRIKEDIPQKSTQSYDMIFVQSHFYF